MSVNTGFMFSLHIIILQDLIKAKDVELIHLFHVSDMKIEDINP